MVGVAAGLANGGRIAFVSAASCFLTARALEQIKADVAYSDRNVKLCGMSPGMAYGELGPTHHSIEDIAWLRAIDNMTVIVPADPIETAAALRWAAATEGPAFIRVSRMSVPEVYSADYEFVPGRAITLRDGGDVTIISNGTVLWRALAAAEQLAAEGIGARVISMPTVKPLDVDAVVAAARETARHRDRRGGHHRRRIWGGPSPRRSSSTIRPGSRFSASRSSPPRDRPASSSIATACRPRASPMPLGSSRSESPMSAPDFRLDGRTAW